MLRSTKVLVSTLGVLFGYIALCGPSAFPADNQAQAIVGVWRLTSYAREEVETGKKIDLFGKRPSGYWSLSRYIIF
jgi:hypothetical protein